jgi:hypothetical protein
MRIELINKIYNMLNKDYSLYDDWSIDDHDIIYRDKENHIIVGEAIDYQYYDVMGLTNEEFNKLETMIKGGEK